MLHIYCSRSTRALTLQSMIYEVEDAPYLLLAVVPVFFPS